jgi:hypothetical protein
MQKSATDSRQTIICTGRRMGLASVVLALLIFLSFENFFLGGGKFEDNAARFHGNAWAAVVGLVEAVVA